MTQRFTVELERAPLYRLNVSVVASNITEAREKAMAYAAERPEEWREEGGAPQVRRITAHKGDAGPDLTQTDATPTQVKEWMKTHAGEHAESRALAWAAHEHFARPFHINVLQDWAAKAKS